MLEAGASEARAESVARFSVLFGDETEEGGGELAKGGTGRKVGRGGGGSEVAADKASKDWGDERSDVRVDVEALIVEHGGGELHHPGKDKKILKVVGYFFGDVLYKVGY